jgi:hypothetical protein
MFREPTRPSTHHGCAVVVPGDGHLGCLPHPSSLASQAAADAVAHTHSGEHLAGWWKLPQVLGNQTWTRTSKST